MIEEIIIKMIDYFNGDIRRINHALKVHSFATMIAKRENVSTDMLRIIEIAAILHDIGIKEAERKYNSTAGSYQEIEGPPIAENLIKQFCLNFDEVERIKFIIGNHHSYSKIDGLDLQILVEGDFIVNIYEDNLDKEVIKKIKEKYFKTKSGSDILDLMYIR
ncbi:HD domain-containing protein [Inconstantimicrobium mannanitabidum]|uniref:HD family phosphohydrolase n=1 Tax=Inconstantimicrobium mannanitabidum TaxID=1604901 RepID=A0ACB5RH59_9CLOT|nr:HD domain-containing protein [Clostridium sp. TW13]GKX68430.1 HD family phosphohydrolase [Clostridium sp. TW13]